MKGGLQTSEAVRRRGSAWPLSAILAVLTASLLSTAALADTPADRERVLRVLLAQRDAALVSERRLADDREAELLRVADQRQRAAQRRFERSLSDAQSDASDARIERDEAQRSYAELAASLVERDEAVAPERAAYRAELEGLVATASPERFAALERFAQGDRVGAWPVLEALRLAKDRAAEQVEQEEQVALERRAQVARERRAVDWREDAELRQIMRDNGEATAGDVLKLWETARELDPNNLDTLLNLSRLYVGELRMADAETAIAAAEAIVPSRDSGEGMVALYRVRIQQMAIARRNEDWSRILELVESASEFVDWFDANVPDQDEPTIATIANMRAIIVTHRSRAYGKLGQNDRAVADARTALELYQRRNAIRNDLASNTSEMEAKLFLADAEVTVAGYGPAIPLVVEVLNSAKALKASHPRSTDLSRVSGMAAALVVAAIVSGEVDADIDTTLNMATVAYENFRDAVEFDPTEQNRTTLANVFSAFGGLQHVLQPDAGPLIYSDYAAFLRRLDPAPSLRQIERLVEADTLLAFRSGQAPDRASLISSLEALAAMRNLTGPERMLLDQAKAGAELTLPGQP